MTMFLSPVLPARRRGRILPLLLALAGCAGLLATVALWAQIGGERGIAPVATTSDIEVSGIEVNVQGDNPQDARGKGWQEAQRLAWKQIGGPTVSDSQLQGLVSGIVIEQERIGPRRYIARLGVIFNRQRAGALLGQAGLAAKSPPMLVIPVTYAAGTATTFEIRNDWQRAWAEFQAGGSRIDYVRPSGAGGQSLLINAGQADRRSRYWWRNILDQFSASGVVMPMARLDYQFPGGPVQGEFTARHGPDNRYIDSFTLTAENPEQLPAMLAQAVRRMDAIYAAAFDSGVLGIDPTLSLQGAEMDPALQRLLQLGEQLRAADRQRAAAAPGVAAPAPARTDQNTLAEEADPVAAPTDTATPAVISTITVQFATPDAGSVDATLGAVRAVGGVRGASTRSLALGGTSVMSVQFAGTLPELAAALRAQGFTVQQGGSALSISR